MLKKQCFYKHFYETVLRVEKDESWFLRSLLSISLCVLRSEISLGNNPSWENNNVERPLKIFSIQVVKILFDLVTVALIPVGYRVHYMERCLRFLKVVMRLMELFQVWRTTMNREISFKTILLRKTLFGAILHGRELRAINPRKIVLYWLKEIGRTHQCYRKQRC